MTKQSATRGLQKKSLCLQNNGINEEYVIPVKDCPTAGENPGQSHLNAKYEHKNTRYLAFKQRKKDICAVRHFQQAETNMEKDKPINLDVSIYCVGEGKIYENFLESLCLCVFQMIDRQCLSNQ
jgi:hypothetical protein